MSSKLSEGGGLIGRQLGRGTLGQDDEEGRPPARVHGMQVQDAALAQALQAVRILLASCLHVLIHLYFSFELGGEKKTKGAALQFVSASLFQCIL